MEKMKREKLELFKVDRKFLFFNLSKRLSFYSEGKRAEIKLLFISEGKRKHLSLASFTRRYRQNCNLVYIRYKRYKSTQKIHHSTLDNYKLFFTENNFLFTIECYKLMGFWESRLFCSFQQLEF